jgi:hypothetical protein
VTRTASFNLTLSVSAPAPIMLPLSLPLATCTHSSHSCTSNRKILSRYTWGSGFAGQLASGRRDNAVWPQVVKTSVYSRSLHSLRVDQVACGGAHTLMRFDDGTVASCGCDKSSPFRNLKLVQLLDSFLIPDSGMVSLVKARFTSVLYPLRLRGLHLARSGR